MKQANRATSALFAAVYFVLALLVASFSLWPPAGAAATDIEPAGESSSGPRAGASAQTYPLWTVPVPLDVNWLQSVAPSSAVDATGRAHVVWKDGQWGVGLPVYYEWTIRHTFRRTNGTWAPLVDLGRGDEPVTAADGQGDVHVVWAGERWIGPNRYFGIHYRRWDADSLSWSPAVSSPPAVIIEYEFTRFVTEIASSPTIAADAQGNLHVAWVHARDSRVDINHRKWDAASGSWSQVHNVSNNDYHSSDPDIVLADGQPHLVWRDGDRVVYSRWDASSGSWFTPVRLPWSGEDPAIAVTSNGHIHVAWSNRVIFHTRWDGNSWSAATNLCWFLGAPDWYQAAKPDIAAVDNDLYVFWQWQESEAIDYDEVFYRQWIAAEGDWETYAYSVPTLRDSEMPSVAVSAVTGHMHLAYAGWVDATSNEFDVFYTTTDGGTLAPWGPIAGTPTWTAIPPPPTATMTPTQTRTPTRTPTPTQTPTPTNTLTPTPAVSIVVTRGTVKRQGTGFSVTLDVANQGTGSASEVVITEHMTGFQALPEGLLRSTTASVNPGYWLLDKKCQVTFTIGDLAAGGSASMTYYIVPILFPSAPSYEIGASTSVSFQSAGGVTYRQNYAIPPTQVEVDTGSYKSVADATDHAIGEADYLIVTKPTQLFNLYGDTTEVDHLYAKMAQLAYLKDGVLGYPGSGSKLDDLIEPSGAWAKKLHSDFSTAGGGYLLIVGEAEIISAWKASGFGLKWEDGDPADVVDLTDHPFADTTGDGGAPELVVGRIIGDSPVALTKPISATIGVHQSSTGYAFDRSHALLISGTGEGEEDFVDDVNDVETILQGKQLTVTKRHWKDYWMTSWFQHDYQEHDGFAVGDVMGDSKEEIIIADRGNYVWILDKDGNVAGGFTRTFDEGDGLAVGDVTGGDKEEIIIGDESSNDISVYNSSGTRLKHFGLNDFESYDGLAAGDVTGGSKDEIVFADRGDHIYAFDADGNTLADFEHAYQEHDGLAVGEAVSVSPNQEIVIASRSKNAFYGLSGSGTRLFTETHTFDAGDALAMGDVDPDAYGDEIIIGDISEDEISVYQNVGLLTIIQFDLESYDALAAGNVLGGAPDEILIADRSDYIRITDATHSVMHSTFRTNAPSRDVILYSGHGKETRWGYGLDTGHFPLSFGGVNPFVFAAACLTGNHAGSSIAEAFLDSGAATYIGSAELAPQTYDSQHARWFFNNWDNCESVGDTLTELERDKISKSTWQKYWVYEYNLYGDPKFGVANCSATGASVPAAQVPPSSVQVTVPDYQVTVRDAFDYVEIPGGEVLLEDGQYRIPYYSIAVDYPAGYRVQEVMVSDRSGLVTATGLNLPITTMYNRSSQGGDGRVAGSGQGWIPDKTHRWATIESPDGSTTLVIMIYPFYYDPASTDVQFYQSYDLAIHYVSSAVEFTGLVTDHDAYAQGETVMIQIGLENAGPAQDVALSASIRRFGTDEVVDTLPRQQIDGLSGEASRTAQWNSAGFAAGYYYVEASVEDAAGNQLDRQAVMFRLGVPDAKIVLLSARPYHFEIGDRIDMQVVLRNTGTMALSGRIVLRVQNRAGETVRQFSHEFINLGTGDTIASDDVWDTSAAQEGSYRIVGYALYEGQATAAKAVVVSTEPLLGLYLPVVMKRYSPGASPTPAETASATVPLPTLTPTPSKTPTSPARTPTATLTSTRAPTPTATATVTQAPTRTPTATSPPVTGLAFLYDHSGAQTVGRVEDWEAGMTWTNDGQAQVVTDPKGRFGQVAKVYVRGYGHGTETSWVKRNLDVPINADIVAIPLASAVNGDVNETDSEAGIEIAVYDPASGRTVMTYASQIFETRLEVDYIFAFADVSEFQGAGIELTITLRQPDVCASYACTQNVDLFVGDLTFEVLPDICTTEADQSHTVYHYYDDPTPHGGVGCANPQPYYFVDLEDGPHNAYGPGNDNHDVTVNLPAGAQALQFKVYYGRKSQGFSFNGHELMSEEVYAAFPIHQGTYVNIAEPSRWMPVNDSPASVNAYLVDGTNHFVFNVYAENNWEERPFDLWARFRVPTSQ